MVGVVKGKLDTRNRIADHVTSRSVGVRKFKIYAENENVKVRSRDSINVECKRKSVPATDEINQGGLKCSEKTTQKLDGLVKTNVGRKVLADISNARASFLRNELLDGSKPVKGKSKRISYSQRASVGPGTKTGGSSSKPLTENLSQVIGDRHDLKRDSKVSSDDARTKIQGRKSVSAIGRTSRRTGLPPIRKSMPVLTRFNEVDTRDVTKESAESSRKAKERYGFPVKPKVGTKVAPQLSNARSHIGRNRVSDGFIMASRDQAKVDARAISRKLVKPAVKPAFIVSNTRKTSKYERTSALKVSTSGAAINLKGKEKVAPASIPENIAPVVPQEQPAREEQSDSNSSLSTTVIISRRKSDRRKSFTSSLMAGSKEHAEGSKKQELLPNIYDDCNHLEVAQYVDDIYQYYWVMEAHNRTLKNYMEIQTEITPQTRGILVNWLVEVHLKFDLMQETLYLMVTLLDQYLSSVSTKKNEMQLVGLTALLLASKYEDFWHPRIMDLIGISAESYTREQVLGMEKAMLKNLKFRLNAPTPYVFMLRFVKAAQSDKKFQHLAFYLIELCLVEYEALNFKPSLLCASAIYVARCTLHMTPAWTPLLRKHSHYEESQIRECAEMILRFHRAARMGIFRVTYDKFTEIKYSSVAAIKPLNRLPLRWDS